MVNTLRSTSVEALEVLEAPGGVEVHLLRSTRFKTVHLHWIVEAPLDEARSARALLPDLLTRGTASYPGLAALGARCEELYNTDLLAAVTAHGGRQVLHFGVETIADRFASGPSLFGQVVDLLTELLHEPPLVGGEFRPDHIDQEKTNMARAIDSLADDKSLYAYRCMAEAMHAGTDFAPHSWGTAAAARELDEAAVHAAWDHVRSAAPARLMIVGDVAPELALQTAARLSGTEVPREPPATPARPPARSRDSVLELEQEQPLSQSRLVMGFRMPRALLPGPAGLLCSLVLGGGSHSRLFKRVREAESLAYGCGASAMMDSGTLVVQAGVDAKSVGRVREIVLEELSRLAEDGVEEEEFELSRRAQRRRIRGLADTPSGLLGFRLRGLMTGRVHDAAQALADLDAARPADVTAMAAGCELDTVFVLKGTAT